VTGDPVETILEGESPIDALEKTVEWLKQNKGKILENKVVIHTFHSKGKWKAFIRYFTA
jgi:hypothetical protein